ncbi:hypothetical protein [Thiopseudomonas denitrificans]|uniref:hypothetical protein n=1 Tax=Thiopseudomonas denitrificans TaxID=1501432 RepID=UPI0010601019|nr:hypothetical protein [Thiopseudomonas denitrificans]
MENGSSAGLYCFSRHLTNEKHIARLAVNAPVAPAGAARLACRGKMASFRCRDHCSTRLTAVFSRPFRSCLQKVMVCCYYFQDFKITSSE